MNIHLHYKKENKKFTPKSVKIPLGEYRGTVESMNLFIDRFKLNDNYYSILIDRRGNRALRWEGCFKIVRKIPDGYTFPYLNTIISPGFVYHYPSKFSDI